MLFLAATDKSEQRFVVIAASATNPLEIARKAKVLNSRSIHGLVISTSDCGEKTGIFALATGIELSLRAARIVLGSTKLAVPDAYIKTCAVKRESLLSLRIPAVDSSIADVPIDTVNWSNADRVSEAHYLTTRAAVVFIRHYSAAPGDPLEGRRERVVSQGFQGNKTVLDEQCTNPHFSEVPKGIFLSCAYEQAADHIFHLVKIFDSSGVKVQEIDHCRNPKWLGEKKLECDSESVDLDGNLALTKKTIALQ